MRECYSWHSDWYPKGLGAELIEALRSPFCKMWEDVAERCGSKNENTVIAKPEDAFLKVQGDLDYIILQIFWPTIKR